MHGQTMKACALLSKVLLQLNSLIVPVFETKGLNLPKDPLLLAWLCTIR